MNARYRCSPHLVCYWRRRQFIVENYARRTRVSISPVACELLDFFQQWRTGADVARRYPQYESGELAAAVAGLVDTGLVERTARADQSAADPLVTWDEWAPAAAYFHCSTKDAHGRMDPSATIRRLRRRARLVPPPPPAKEYPSRPRVPLPPPLPLGEFERVLLERRTWREFSTRPLESAELSTLLRLSFGIQSWLEVPGVGRSPLKTSPSGGARHPLEAYVFAIRVRGLASGVYHYNAVRHCLERLKPDVTAARFVDRLNGQTWFRGAAAGVFLSAVFARTQWKYRAARAYRAVLLEAGHACQTFCLVATRLGLAPFCTMAFADTPLEADLGLDGITESVLYAAGVGTRPAPVPKTDTIARRSAVVPAASASRARRRRS